MKTLNLALISLLTLGPVSTMAQTTTTTTAATISTATGVTTATETSNNALLLENAKASREQVEKKNANKPVQEIRALGPGQNNINTTNLTDQELQLSQQYLHQGLSNDVMKQNCTGDMASVCNGNEGKHKFMGMDPNMVKAVAQAYAMFGAIAGDSLGSISKGDKAMQADKKAAEEAKAKGESPDKVDSKANDYCKFIPTATEGIATAMQAIKTKELGEDIGNGDTAQKDYLLKAAKSHDSRAKMAQIQAAGWWGGAACYATNAGLGNFAWDKNLLIKMGAATLLGAFYQSEVSANKEYAEKTRKIADMLPNKGDCNPITDNLCYCSQPSTENDPTYCAKGLHKKSLAASSYRVACTTDTLAIDPSCNCEKTNTCFDNYLEVQSEGALELGGLGYSSSPYKSIRSLARGELVGGTLNSSSYDSTMAIAKKGLRELASKIPLDNSPLTKDQKGIADAIASKGVPASVAALMAQNQPSSSATNAAMAKLQGSSGAGLKLASVAPRGSNIVDFSGGNGLGTAGRKNEGGNGAEDILAKLKPGAAKAAPNSKILEFAQKAEARAQQANQIRKDNNTPLFEIISMRYQTSGRRLLEVDAEGK